MKKKKKFKIKNNLLIVICVAVIIGVALILQTSFSKYIFTGEQYHSQEASRFYFESDIADIEEKNYSVIDDGEKIGFNVSNYENESLYTKQDISFTIAATSVDGITVKILNESLSEVTGTETLKGGQVSTNNYYLEVSKSSSFTDTSFEIDVTITSSSPYEKEITSTIQVYEAENEVSLEIAENGEYATLRVTTNVLESIYVAFDDSKMQLDENSLGSFTYSGNVCTLDSGNITLNETYELIFIISSGSVVTEDDFTI